MGINYLSFHINLHLPLPDVVPGVSDGHCFSRLCQKAAEQLFVCSLSGHGSHGTKDPRAAQAQKKEETTYIMYPKGKDD